MLGAGVDPWNATRVSHGAPMFAFTIFPGLSAESLFTETYSSLFYLLVRWTAASRN